MLCMAACGARYAKTGAASLAQQAVLHGALSWAFCSAHARRPVTLCAWLSCAGTPRRMPPAWRSSGGSCCGPSTPPQSWPSASASRARSLRVRHRRCRAERFDGLAVPVHEGNASGQALWWWPAQEELRLSQPWGELTYAIPFWGDADIRHLFGADRHRDAQANRHSGSLAA
jgi:hypothetical protein